MSATDMVDPLGRERYARQLLLFGERGQKALAQSRVLVLGAGGLGSVVVPYLAAAGVGTIGVLDDGFVELSNLHRQVMHSMSALDEPKVSSAAEAAARVNPTVRVVRIHERLDAANAQALLDGWDVVVDGLDTFAARFAVSDAASALGTPHVWGSVLGYDGQASVFTGPITLRTLFPTVPSDADVDSCSTVGVLGPVCAAIGGVMATETVKLLTGVGDPLVGRVSVYDALDGSWREVPLRAGGPETDAGGAASNGTIGSRIHGADDATGPSDPLHARAAAAGGADAPTPGRARIVRSSRPVVPAVDVETLRADVAEDAVEQLIVDLREDDEVALEPGLPGALRLPFGDFMRGARPDAALRDRELVLYCAHGVRSGIAAPMLIDEGWSVAHIEGGLERYLRG